ncbi:hypothetical protein ACFL2H_10860 [Planctomycetota bacterium]
MNVLLRIIGIGFGSRDAIVDVLDVDLLCGGVRAGAGDFDLDGNGIVNQADLEYLVETILGTSIGDSTLDGLFNSTDFVTIFRSAEYEDAILGNSTWADGDWNCDGDFTTRDLVYAFQRGNYSAASIANNITSVDRSFAALIPLHQDRASDEIQSIPAADNNTPSDSDTDAIDERALNEVVTELIFAERETPTPHHDDSFEIDMDSLLQFAGS